MNIYCFFHNFQDYLSGKSMFPRNAIQDSNKYEFPSQTFHVNVFPADFQSFLSPIQTSLVFYSLIYLLRDVNICVKLNTILWSRHIWLELKLDCPCFLLIIRNSVSQYTCTTESIQPSALKRYTLWCTFILILVSMAKNNKNSFNN